MPAPEDGVAYFAVAAMPAVYVGACILAGAAPGYRGLVRRHEQPFTFWAVMAIAGIGAIAFVYVGLLAAPQWPLLLGAS